MPSIPKHATELRNGIADDHRRCPRLTLTSPDRTRRALPACGQPCPGSDASASRAQLPPPVPSSTLEYSGVRGGRRLFQDQ
ncbi:hypothetical protein C8Q80DRAFT_809183 [Daedaleopsis nitida]|nr:hypothetical protein C8Q80DRAFT_809183 [Daedaleopsis nitida]